MIVGFSALKSDSIAPTLILHRDRLDVVARRGAPHVRTDSAERDARCRRRDQKSFRGDGHRLDDLRDETASARSDDRGDSDVVHEVRRGVRRGRVVRCVVAFDEHERTRFAVGASRKSDDGAREIVDRELDALHARDAARRVDARQREDSAEDDRVVVRRIAVDLRAFVREKRFARFRVVAADCGLAAVARRALRVGRARAAGTHAHVSETRELRAAGVEPARGAVTVGRALNLVLHDEKRARSSERRARDDHPIQGHEYVPTI